MRKEIKGTRLSPYKLSQVINEFVFNTPARVCAEKLHLHRNTVNLWYGKMREGISNLPDPEPFSGEVEIDESYFGKKKQDKEEQALSKDKWLFLVYVSEKVDVSLLRSSRE